VIPPESSSFRHAALLYESTDEYVAAAVPFLKDGIEAGEGAIVAHTRSGIALMRAALGRHASQVSFIDVGFAYTRPARTRAAYHAVFTEQLQRAPAVRAIADVQFGADPREWGTWMGYEAATNRAFRHLAASIVCSYDARHTPEPILDSVWQTHPEVVADQARKTSQRFQDPDDLIRRVTRAPTAPLELGTIPCGSDIEQLRERLAQEMHVADVPSSRAFDMLLAVTEVASNAEKHGGGMQEVRAGRCQGRFVCEIVDRGDGFDDPAAGFVPPCAGVGAGLWIARQLAWEIEFFRGPAGFTTRIWL
jgi:anti-sigma regulatory factor (Ser/Thr protein kinase)